ncbi:MAG: cadherin-like domain-containing protein [Polaribacter sp.]|nr:cadherin-like domain-containing protein [Polaribacter sp.]
MYFFICPFIFIKISCSTSCTNCNKRFLHSICNTALNINAPGILENDTDADGDALTVTEFLFNSNTYAAGTTVNFTQGTITIFADGSFTYIPTTDFLGNVPENKLQHYRWYFYK